MTNQQPRVLTRAKHGVVSGTLAGFAEYYNLNLAGLRFVFLVTLLFGGLGLIFYIVLRLSIPAYSERERLIAEKIARQG